MQADHEAAAGFATVCAGAASTHTQHHDLERHYVLPVLLEFQSLTSNHETLQRTAVDVYLDLL